MCVCVCVLWRWRKQKTETKRQKESVCETVTDRDTRGQMDRERQQIFNLSPERRC